MSGLKTGDKAPDFTLPRSGGGNLSLRELHGHKVVLYLYPKDDTPGCTKEACGFRDAQPRMEELNAIVVGVSPDGVASHDRFAAKYNLPFALVADTEHEVADAYGVWQQKSMYGNKYMSVQRSTFVIDENGTLTAIWPKVKPEGHANEVLATLRGPSA
ncbi:MAG: thioredoxin-dependent thiol peroxidase [Chloroflexota bacterium]